MELFVDDDIACRFVGSGKKTGYTSDLWLIAVRERLGEFYFDKNYTQLISVLWHWR